MPQSEVRSLVVTAPGGSDVLAVERRPVTDPGPHEVQVRVAASGVNFVDVYQREGVYPTPTPFVLGSEGAGEVVAVGTEATGVAVGDSVGWVAAPGSHAELLNVPSDRLVPVPDGVAHAVAAAVLLQGVTAHYLVTSTRAVQPGDTVLVHAAAGGVGQLLIQLAKARGARVLGTVSTAEKESVARGAGADEVLRYDDGPDPDDLADRVRRANGGRGVAVVYDGVGRATFEASLRSLEPRGLLALFGAASGQVPPFDVQRLNSAGSLFLTRPSLAHYTATREELLWRGGEVLGAVRDGHLRVQVGGRYALDDAAQAYDDLESRRTTGKLLLIP